MKHITTSHKILLLAVVSCLGSCLLYWFVGQSIDKKVLVFNQARDTRAHEIFEDENQEQAQAILNKTADVRTTLEGHLLSVDEPLEFLALVDDAIPRITGAPTEVKSISKEEAEDTDDSGKEPPRVRVVLSAEGDWNNLFHLLLLIEHLPYAVSLDRAVLNASETGGEYDWKADVFLTGGTKK